MTIMSGQELVSAAKAGSLDRVSYHLKKGVLPDVRDEEGYTALYWAACRGHSAICRILLLHDADVNSQTKTSGATALMACADNNQVACMEGLLRQKLIRIDQRSARGDTALHMGAYRGHVSVVQLLIQYHTNPFIQNNFKRTALEEAQTQDELACVDILRRYMDLYKPHLDPRLKVSNHSKESAVSSRQPTESQWTKKTDIYTPVHKTHTKNRDLGMPCSHPSFQSTDSAVVISPPNSIGSHPSSKSFKTSEDLQLSLDCSMGNGEGSVFDCEVNGNNFSSEISRPNTPNSPSFRSQSFLMNPASADSQYHSYTCTPSPNDIISLENETTSMSVSVGNKRPTDSLSPQITSASGKTRPLRSAHDKCEKHPSRMNDLSCKGSSDGITYDILPSSVQSLNILPDGKAQVDLNVRSNQNHSSETSMSAYGNLEVVRGVKISEFIKNLQMQLLQYESALRKEQQMNCDLQQQIKALKEENIKLKVTMHSLHKTLCQKSSSVN